MSRASERQRQVVEALAIQPDDRLLDLVAWGMNAAGFAAAGVALVRGRDQPATAPVGRTGADAEKALDPAPSGVSLEPLL